MKLFRSILIVDDETRWLRAMAVTLRQEVPEAKVSCCENSRQALGMVKMLDADLVLLDLNMPHVSGEELLDSIRQQAPFTRIIVVTGINDTATAVRCVKRGAYDFFEKGGRLEQLVACIRRALEVAALEVNFREVTQSFLSNSRSDSLPGVISQSPKMRDCSRYAAALTRSPYPLVLEGEEGVGKRIFAKGLAQLLSSESEPIIFQLPQLGDNILKFLFGQIRGAFKVGEPAQLGIFEQHRGGVVILEGLFSCDVAMLEPVFTSLVNRQYCPIGSVQGVTLPCKVILLIDRPLQQLCDQGQLSYAQFLALHTHHIVLPPLRDRPEDVGLLAAHFMEEACEHFNQKLTPLGFEVVQQLEQEQWPGNISELRARVFRAVALGESQQVNLQALIGVASKENSIDQALDRTQFPDKLPTLSEIQQQLIQEALKRCGYCQKKAAKILRISQSALSRRLRIH